MRTNILLLLLFIYFAGTVVGQSRKIIYLPDIPGYKTLKCDFHMHTVFSDGTVWPTVRVEEAWREGLDAIAITDHIEYRPHSKDVISDFNRSFEIAQPLANSKNIILIRGAEITRSMPPGHLNAIFIKNANLLDREDVFDAIREARDQGAFIFWNHPGWKVQQPDTTLWWEEHTRLLNNNLMHGIEVFNSEEYYPEAIDWAAEKKLAVMCNTDVHGPINLAYNLEENHRPLTLVFAINRTAERIKQALFEKRTVAYFGNTLIGPSKLLEPLFFASLEIKTSATILKSNESKVFNMVNNSDVDYELELMQPGVGFDAPESIVLQAHRETPMELRGNSAEVEIMNVLTIYYQVKNMFVSSDENLVVALSLKNK